MQLDARLEAVAGLVRAKTHCDIGTDHAYLLAALLRRGRIEQAIAVEKTAGPVANARRTLAGKSATVRHGDGLSVIEPGEIDSVSLCGMGGELIVRILERHPDRVPSEVITQPNSKPEVVRRWAAEAGFHLSQELLVRGALLYPIIGLKRSTAAGSGSLDPAYSLFDSPILRDAAFLFGPLNLARRSSVLQDDLRSQVERLQTLPQLNEQSTKLLQLVQAAREWLAQPGSKQ
ncbi:MAG: tRNA (adenine(22)-N(1))-methyltransferase TrmK [Aureliella sp.]